MIYLYKESKGNCEKEKKKQKKIRLEVSHEISIPLTYVYIANGNKTGQINYIDDKCNYILSLLFLLDFELKPKVGTKAFI